MLEHGRIVSYKAMLPSMIRDGVFWLWPNYDSEKWVLCFPIAGAWRPALSIRRL
jgi:hypothetical protein